MTHNIAASVHQRLLNQARAQERPLFVGNPEKQTQWQAFVRRFPQETTPPTLEAVVQCIAAFLQPVVQALVEGQDFEQYWRPGGPWRERQIRE